MKYIDNFLNKVTMYKLVLFGLLSLSVLSILFAFLGWISYTGISLIYTLVTLTVVCFVTNYIFSKLFKVKTNAESYIITSLILFLIVFPIETFSDLKLVALVGFVAMASKYLLAINKKHVFNPAAIGLFILGFFGYGMSAWWVGSSVMLVPVTILGFLVLRKVRRFSLFFAFMITAVVSISVVGMTNGQTILEILKQIFVSWPLLFFGSIMLTEPLTTPPTKKLQIAYGAIVGILFGIQFKFYNLYSTPEFALIVGNIFSYIVSPRARLILTLIEKNKLTADVYDFIFKSDEKLKFKPGQYLEWTISPEGADIRGNRRYFTVASSPTEENIYLGTKFYQNPSTFKQKLLAMNSGDSLIASQLSGEFTMPDDSKKKLVFIAGGIGVTPFRSMAKYLIDKKESRDVVLFYSTRTLADAAYKDIFDTAEREVGFKNIYVVNDLGVGALAQNIRVGFVTAEMITKEVPDFKERMFYISGTHSMVSMFEDTLSKLGVSNSQIKVDFFPGFV